MFSEDLKEHQPYHHGNVKGALIDAAMALIDTNQTDAISLRRLAKEVGVTPSAVYNHFADKDSLMLAIKIRLYEELNRFFDSRCEDSSDPEQGLLDVCYAYYRFSQEQPARFLFLFSSVLPLERSTPEFIEVACHSLVRSRKLIYKVFEKYNIPCKEEDVINTTILVWSQLHGIVMLRNSGSIPAVVAYQDWPVSCGLNNDDEVEKLIRENVNMTVNAILNKQHSDSHH
ncbi:MAG: TetR/AcrR family transcriptional regulator [Gammaproteobacteria bacterium]